MSSAPTPNPDGMPQPPLQEYVTPGRVEFPNASDFENLEELDVVGLPSNANEVRKRSPPASSPKDRLGGGNSPTATNAAVPRSPPVGPPPPPPPPLPPAMLTGGPPNRTSSPAKGTKGGGKPPYGRRPYGGPPSTTGPLLPPFGPPPHSSPPHEQAAPFSTPPPPEQLPPPPPDDQEIASTLLALTESLQESVQNTPDAENNEAVQRSVKLLRDLSEVEPIEDGGGSGDRVDGGSADGGGSGSTGSLFVWSQGDWGIPQTERKNMQEPHDLYARVWLREKGLVSFGFVWFGFGLVLGCYTTHITTIPGLKGSGGREAVGGAGVKEELEPVAPELSAALATFSRQLRGCIRAAYKNQPDSKLKVWVV